MSPARCTTCRTTYRSATAHYATATHRDRAYRAHNVTGAALAAERAESARVRRLGSRDAYDAYLAAESLRDAGYILSVAIAAGIGIPPEPAEGTAYFDAVAAEPRIDNTVSMIPLKDAAADIGTTANAMRVAIHRRRLTVEAGHLVKVGRDWYVTPAGIEHYKAHVLGAVGWRKGRSRK